MTDFFSIVETVAANGIKNQIIKDSDYYNEQGILICGKCRKPRQIYRDFKQGEHSLKLLTTCECDCDIEQKRIVQEKEKAQIIRKRVNKLHSDSLMEEKHKQASFERFEVNSANAKNLKLCKRYATAFDEMIKKNQGLILWGNVGTGKSYAAACIANYLLDKGIPVVMISTTRLLKFINEGFENEEIIFSRMKKAKLVIFDELGADRGNDFALEKLYNIIDFRYSSNKPMIITTNLTLNQMMDAVDVRYARIYDRILEVCYPMQFTGNSFRKRNAAKRFDEMKAFLEQE